MSKAAELCILMLTDIDRKLNDRWTEAKPVTFTGKLSGREITVEGFREPKYSPSELMDMWGNKHKIIKLLLDMDMIEDEEYEKYLLSSDGTFTPKIKNPKT